MASISGIDKVKIVLNQQRQRGNAANVAVLVGYTANYALYVHENREIWPPGMRLAGQPRKSPHKGQYWDPQGQAQPGFLLEPARAMRSTLAQMIRASMRSGRTMLESLLMAGMRLQRESMKLVPVDTGNLRASAFTRQE